MSLDAFLNFAFSTLAAGITSGATTLSVTAGEGVKFPAVFFNAVIWNSTDYPSPELDPNVEIVRVTGISTDTFTITRGQESTSAVAHNTGGKTYKILAGITALTANNLAAKDLTPRILVSTGIATSSTSSTSEANLANFKIPAGTIGANGQIEVRGMGKAVGTVSAKAMSVRLTTASGSVSGGFQFFSLAPSASNLGIFVQKYFWNANSQSAQIAAGGLGAGSSSANLTGTIDTSADTWINFNANVGNAGDSIQYVSYSVILWPGV